MNRVLINKSKMQEVVLNQNIEQIVHFTHADNLESIFKQGLLSVDELDEVGIGYYYNDEYRLDNVKKASCFSIEFPNYKYFYRIRQESEHTNWAILILDKSILWKKDCIFCVENAASKNITNIPVNERRGVKAFKKLFKDIPGYPSREVLGIPKEYPTHPQAEVLVCSTIEVKYIKAVVFENYRTKKKYASIKPANIEYIVDKGGFKYRCDYEHW